MAISKNAVSWATDECLRGQEETLSFERKKLVDPAKRYWGPVFFCSTLVGPNFLSERENSCMGRYLLHCWQGLYSAHADQYSFFFPKNLPHYGIVHSFFGSDVFQDQ